jgi:CheY-like chemotaxis protein
MMRVLVVEDDADVLGALVTVLEDQGYEVATARNGLEALERLRSGPRPAIILLDLMMPEMSGFEFRARQLADPSIADLPVAVLTAGALSERVRDLRPVACFVKPFELDALLDLLESPLAA